MSKPSDFQLEPLTYQQNKRRKQYTDRCDYFNDSTCFSDAIHQLTSELYLYPDGLALHKDARYFEEGHEIKLRVPVSGYKHTQIDNSFVLLPIKNRDVFELCAQPGIEIDLFKLSKLINNNNPVAFQQHVDEFASLISAQIPSNINLNEYLATQNCILYRKMGDDNEICCAKQAMPKSHEAPPNSSVSMLEEIKMINQAISDGPRFGWSFKMPTCPAAASDICELFRETRDNIDSVGENAYHLDRWSQALDDETYFFRVQDGLSKDRLAYRKLVQKFIRDQQPVEKSTFQLHEEDFPPLD